MVDLSGISWCLQFEGLPVIVTHAWTWEQGLTKLA